jgi:hypothetical protein
MKYSPLAGMALGPWFGRPQLLAIAATAMLVSVLKKPLRVVMLIPFILTGIELQSGVLPFDVFAVGC